MEEQYKYDLFDRYLRGELGQQELDNFLEELKSNEELKEEFDQYHYLVEGIREHEKQELKGYMVKNARTRYIGNPWSLTFTYASAAILIGFGLLYFVLDNLNLKKDSDIAVNQPVEVPKNREKDLVDYGDVGTEENKEEIAESVPPPPINHVDTSIHDGETIVHEPEEEVSADEVAFPEIGDQSRMARAHTDNEYPVKEDSRIMDTMITLSIQFEMDKKQLIDTMESLEKEKSFHIESEKILVQFWKSPINYKGYRFDGRKLVLFGLDTFSLVQLKYRVLDHGLKVYDIYLVYGNLQVKLIDNNRYNAYIRETNPGILNELK